MVLLALLIGAGVPGPAVAQARCTTDFVPLSRDASWNAPLDRPVSLQASELPLRDVLDLLAEVGMVRISYASDLLPLDRVVCLRAFSEKLGDALLALVGNMGVRPVAVAPAHVVLTPEAREQQREPAFATLPVIPLQGVVVTGSAGEVARGSTPYARDVITGEQLASRGGGSVLTLLGFGGASWAPVFGESSVSSFVGRRGASSFRSSFPKVYLDGIEVINPLLLASLTAEEIDRVEVIRGPQGSALYGPDASAGVVEIRSRQSGIQESTRVRVSSTAGLGEGSGPGTGISQNHMLSLHFGDPNASGILSVGYGRAPDPLTAAETRSLSLSTNGRAVARSFMGSGTFRLSRFDLAPAAPAPPGATQLGLGISPIPGSARFDQATQYTIGGTLGFSPTPAWTHTVVVGFDGFRIEGTGDAPGAAAGRASRVPLVGLRGGERGSLRISSAMALPGTGHTDGTLTFGAEQVIDRGIGMSGLAVGGQATSAVPLLSPWRSSTGFLVQGDLSLQNLLYLNGGLRFELSDDVATASPMPMLGASLVSGSNGWDGALRAAYGRGIRPVRGGATGGEALIGQYPLIALAMEPEVQSGLEFGLDLSRGRAFDLRLTRFEQTAFNLVQAGLVPIRRFPNQGDDGVEMVAVLQNVGQISNRGWEVEASAAHGIFSLGGQLSQVESRVVRVARGYVGDLRPGDRMPDVPAAAGILTGTVAGGRWTASVMASRAWDWVSPDATTFPEISEVVRPSIAATGSGGIWATFDGPTLLGATWRYRITPAVTIQLEGSNLLGGMPALSGNLLVPARTLSFGLSASF